MDMARFFKGDQMSNRTLNPDRFEGIVDVLKIKYNFPDELIASANEMLRAIAGRADEIVQRLKNSPKVQGRYNHDGEEFVGIDGSRVEIIGGERILHKIESALLELESPSGLSFHDAMDVIEGYGFEVDIANATLEFLDSKSGLEEAYRFGVAHCIDVEARKVAEARNRWLIQQQRELELNRQQADKLERNSKTKAGKLFLYNFVNVSGYARIEEGEVPELMKYFEVTEEEARALLYYCVLTETYLEDFIGKRILAVGSDTGWFARAAQALGANEAVSFDPDNTKRDPRSELNPSQDPQDTPPNLPFEDGSFDLVFAMDSTSETTSGPRDTGSFLRETLRVLNSGGEASVFPIESDLNLTADRDGAIQVASQGKEVTEKTLDVLEELEDSILRLRYYRYKREAGSPVGSCLLKIWKKGSEW